MEADDVSASQPKLPSLGWFICILVCIHLHATFWKGPTFFSHCSSLTSRVTVHGTPHSQMKSRPSAGPAGCTGRDQEVAAGLYVKAAGGPFGDRKCFLSSNFHSLIPLLLHLCPVLRPLPLNFTLRPLGTFTVLT